MGLKQYIYLDWNVIQYIKHETVNKKFNAPEFKKLIEELSKIYIFPISEGHLCDLSSGVTEDKIKYIDEDLIFIKAISKGFMLGVDSNEDIIPIQADIGAEFNNIQRPKKYNIEINVTGESYSVDMEKLSKSSLFRPLLEENNGLMDASVMTSFLDLMWESNDDPIFYKKFREEFSSLKSTFEKNDTILNQSSEYFSKLSSLLEFCSIKELDVLREKFNNIMISFLSINNRKLGNLTKGQKIELVYMLLDFHPLFRDKVNKKNRPTNIDRDCKNLFFASNAKYYVTEDDATYKKSSFVVKVLGLKVKVMKMDELRNKVSCI